MNLFKRKSRAEIVEAIIDDTLKNLLILDLTNAELATVINSLHGQGLHVLERRAEELEEELNRTVEAIASFNQ